MPSQRSQVQFRLNSAEEALLIEAAQDDETPNQTAKRLLLFALSGVPVPKPVRKPAPKVAKVAANGLKGGWPEEPQPHPDDVWDEANGWMRKS